MADSGNPKLPRKLDPLAADDPGLQRRLLLALLLAGVVLFTIPLLNRLTNKQPANARKGEEPTTQQAAKPAAPPAMLPAEAPAAPGQVTGEREQSFTVDTNLYQVRFSNRGAVVTSWVLKKFTDSKGQPLEVVNAAARPHVYYPFTLNFLGEKPAYNTSQVLYAMKPTADNLGVDFEYSDGRSTVRKQFRFLRDSYQSEVTSEAVRNGAPLQHALLWRGGFGDAFAVNASTYQHSLVLSELEGKLLKNDFKKAKQDEPVSARQPAAFAGLEDSYFAAVFLPKQQNSLLWQTWTDYVPTAASPKEGDALKKEPQVGVGVGGEGINRFSLFMGPKHLDLLKSVNPRLAQLVDFGWFAFLAKPLFYSLNWLNDNVVHNYGWSIVLATVVINMLLFPLKISSMKSMKKMQSLQPEIARISDKYKNIKMNDPRKAQQNQETMELYRKHGVSPAGGCLPLLLQMPFFFAFLAVLQAATEMRGAQFLWVTDLSQPETIPVRILPLLMVATGFLQQKMTPSASMDPAQQKMLLFMPLMLGFMFYYSPSGLVLYWLTGNVMGIAQQWIFNRLGITGTPAAKAVIEAKPAGKKGK